MRISRPNVLDFEASGLGTYSYPIEVGVVMSSGEKYCSLIFPASDWQYWDDQAEKVHGITRDTLFKYGKPITTVTTELNALLSEKTVYSDGWVVDKPWLTQLFYKSGSEPSFSLSALEMILKEPQMAIWSQTKSEVINDLALRRHRASADALIIQETFNRTLRVLG
jgi:putative intracellular protease/amidase